MSIFDASVQDDWVRDDLISKIKAAEKKYYNESPCLHCGPGNGCDDCRGCEDAKRNYELEKMLRNAREAYKDRFGHSYDEDLMIQQISNKEKENEHWRDYCRKCGGNFGDDCRDCSDLDEIVKVSKSLNWLKEEFKRKYHVDYNDIINKKILKNNKLETMNKSVIEIIKEGIDKNGANEYYNYVSANWSKFENQFKDAVLNEIKKYIKPSKIETIEDLAQLLDGNEYCDEFQNEYKINVEELCNKNKWIIVFGESDDLIEFRGFIDDEDGAWDGTLCKLVKPGDFYLEDKHEETYKKSKEYMFIPIEEDELNIIKNNNYKDTCVIEQLWCPDDSEASWQVNVKGAPFARFNLMEDDRIYCEAAVIDLSNLVK